MANNKQEILIELKILENRALKNLEKVKESIKGLDRRTRPYKEAVAEQVRLETQLASIRGRRVAINSKVETSVNRLNKAEKSLLKTQREGKTAVGASTSATLELGRVLSDMPYGIRGVANNLQQLASNLFFMSKAVDSTTGKAVGFSGAVGNLLKGLIGPAGLLIAFQGVIALIDYFSDSQEKVEESTEDATNQITRQAKEIQRLQRITRTYYEFIGEALSGIKSDGTVFKEELFSIQDVIKILSKDFSEFKDGIDSLSEQDKKDPKKLENLIKSFQSLLKYREDLGDLEKRLDKFRDLQKQSIKSFQEEEGGALINVGDEVSSLTIRYINLQRAILGLESLFENSDDSVKKGKKGSKIDLFDTPEELEIKVKDTLNARQKLAQKTEMISLKTEEKSTLAMIKDEEERTFIKEEYALRRLDITEKYEKKAMLLKKQNAIKSAQETHTEYFKKVDKDLAKFISGIKKEGKALTDAEQKEITRAENVAFDKKKVSGDRLTVAVSQIEEEYSKLFPFWSKMAAVRRAAVGEDKPVKKDEEFTLQEGLQQYMKVQSAMTNFMSGEFDRQLTIEQNKTNALNNELNQRLLNENLSKDERERIQLQIGRNDEKLRKKQEAIEKKRFKLNKAANIAQATISTYLAANKVLVETKGGTVARFVAMAATISAGLLNVAAIARQKFQSSAGSGGAIGAGAGRAGSGGEGREFNFNLAGSTQSNQLTQSIAGQLSQPIQAYVVSSEMTSQQQLDLSISNTATIG